MSACLSVRSLAAVSHSIHSLLVLPDRSIKILELGKLLKRLPRTNFAVLKFIFQHFVRYVTAGEKALGRGSSLVKCFFRLQCAPCTNACLLSIRLRGWAG